jgi:long-chain acyl-CoA synthetase
MLPLQDAAVAFDRTARAHLACGIQPQHGNVHLCASMLYHAAPLEWSAMALHFGHPVVLVERWEPELLLRLIDQRRVTTTFMVPTMFVRLLKLPADVRGQYSTASLRYVGHAAAPCAVEVKRQLIDWWGPIIWESYGASEGSGTIVDSHDWLRYPGTVGRPFNGTKLKILDEEGHEVPPGTVGTIYLTRHTGDRFEYKGDPDKTRAAYRGELFTVGDMGYVNQQGYLFICDRKVDMILCGGINIYPAEIEQVLILHPQVADCMVVGIPDELSGEAIKAVVQPAPGVTPGPKLSLDILDFLTERLDTLKLPRRIEYAEQLPRDPNGKAHRRTLREAHRKAPERVI